VARRNPTGRRRRRGASPRCGDYSSQRARSSPTGAVPHRWQTPAAPHPTAASRDETAGCECATILKAPEESSPGETQVEHQIRARHTVEELVGLQHERGVARPRRDYAIAANRRSAGGRRTPEEARLDHGRVGLGPVIGDGELCEENAMKLTKNTFVVLESGTPFPPRINLDVFARQCSAHAVSRPFQKASR
jgi:hypothetical protein